MADISSEVAFKITQTGAEQVAASLDQVSAATQRAGKETGNLTKFVREHRAESRIQNYLFSETKQAIGSVTFGFMALSGAMGNASESNKKLNQTLITGYSAFQAADFAMAGLGVASGGTALAIASIVGGGSALLAFLDNSATRAKEATIQMQGFADAAKQMAEGIGAKEAAREEEKLNILIGKTSENIKAAQTLRTLERGAGPARIAREASDFLGFTKDQLGEYIKQQESLLGVYKMRRAALIDVIAAEEQLALVEKRKTGVEKEKLYDKYGFLLGRKPEKIPETTPQDLIKMPKLMPGLMGPGEGKPVNTSKTYTDFLGNELDKINAKELVFLGLLDQGVGTLRSTMSFLGIQTDSFIGKLMNALDLALSIAKTVEAISSVGSIVGALFGGGPIGAITAGVGLAGKREQFVNTYNDVVRKGLL